MELFLNFISKKEKEFVGELPKFIHGFIIFTEKIKYI